MAGLTCTDSQPLRPASRAWIGARVAAPRTAISSTMAQVSSTSVQAGLAAASSRILGTQKPRSLASTSSTIGGLEVAPVAPRSIA